ncbi:hypothetical protein Ple7327_3631 [Pleurocapsa sp. PCC 7327]|uniref:hypothetical protein n=1 Tax=Pleurocapsa sp. PCC 7327 TaxID=118163 RepID=UPI00029FE9DC|nr:hypothetical protein [Pleurocapsa sp. PCC 7327]AFY78826.1 hypothetical protein Ple7327_3631 [Pleurocapsa sp. PCC 7327]
MFGKPQKENKPSDPADLLDTMMSSQLAKTEEKTEEFELFDRSNREPTQESSELVNTVEKISRIISPYFIVIVGLVLYDNNFLIGTTLIAIGILSLLKVSLQDIIDVIEDIKNIFVSTETNFSGTSMRKSDHDG